MLAESISETRSRGRLELQSEQYQMEGGGPDASLEGIPFDLPIPKAGTGAQPFEIEDLELVLVGVGLGLAMVTLTALVE